jgi:hypothetical protein
VCAASESDSRDTLCFCNVFSLLFAATHETFAHRRFRQTIAELQRLLDHFSALERAVGDLVPQKDGARLWIAMLVKVR